MQEMPQLFCFTYAGGTAAFFKVIEPLLDGIEVVNLEYAGHGERHKEPCYPDFDALADDMLHEVTKRLHSHYALFGYSMGSITLIEVLKRIITRGMPLPFHVFLAAHEPHAKSELRDFTADELDEWVKRRTIEFGAIPEKLLVNRVFWRTYLPLYRTDYTIIGKYEFKKLDLKTEIPVDIFYSETDTPRQEMELWRRYFRGDCEYHCYEGKHFFIQEHSAEMAAVIREKLGVSAADLQMSRMVHRSNSGEFDI